MGKAVISQNYIKEVLNIHPESLLFARYAYNLLLNNKVNDAFDVAKEGVAQFQNYTSGRFVLALCLIELRELTLASEQLQEILKIEPNHLAAMEKLSLICQRIGQTDKSRAVADLLLRHNSKSALLQGLSPKTSTALGIREIFEEETDYTLYVNENKIELLDDENENEIANAENINIIIPQEQEDSDSIEEQTESEPAQEQSLVIDTEAEEKTDAEIEENFVAETEVEAVEEESEEAEETTEEEEIAESDESDESNFETDKEQEKQSVEEESVAEEEGAKEPEPVSSQKEKPQKEKSQREENQEELLSGIDSILDDVIDPSLEIADKYLKKAEDDDDENDEDTDDEKVEEVEEAKDEIILPQEPIEEIPEEEVAEEESEDVSQEEAKIEEEEKDEVKAEEQAPDFVLEESEEEEEPLFEEPIGVESEEDVLEEKPKIEIEEEIEAELEEAILMGQVNEEDEESPINLVAETLSEKLDDIEKTLAQNPAENLAQENVENSEPEENAEVFTEDDLDFDNLLEEEEDQESTEDEELEEILDEIEEEKATIKDESIAEKILEQELEENGFADDEKFIPAEENPKAIEEEKVIGAEPAVEGEDFEKLLDMRFDDSFASFKKELSAESEEILEEEPKDKIEEESIEENFVGDETDILEEIVVEDETDALADEDEDALAAENFENLLDEIDEIEAIEIQEEFDEDFEIENIVEDIINESDIAEIENLVETEIISEIDELIEDGVLTEIAEMPEIADIDEIIEDTKIPEVEVNEEEIPESLPEDKTFIEPEILEHDKNELNDDEKAAEPTSEKEAFKEMLVNDESALILPDHILTPTFAQIYLEQGQPYLAKQIFERLTLQDPDNDEYDKQLKEIEELVAKLEKGEEFVMRAKAYTPKKAHNPRRRMPRAQTKSLKGKRIKPEIREQLKEEFNHHKETN